MGITGGIFIYFIVWWVVFMAVLPWGVRSQHESGRHVEGTEPGAPVRANMGRKVLITSLIAAGICVVIFLAVRAGVFDIYPKSWGAS